MTTIYPGDSSESRPHISLKALRRFTLKQTDEPPITREHCELCGEPLPSEHHHLLALSSRACLCACNACALLFKSERQQARYKTVPRRFLTFVQFHLEDEAWEALALPVNMVYIFRTGKGARAFYPSPAGAMESLLDLDDWENITQANPHLQDMEEEVEALLINRVRGHNECYLVPIDTCYQLVGLIRLCWRGLSGGQEAWEAIDSFFRDLRERATVIDEGEQPCQI
ncbi:DUF5947 family protein [Ktedonospora formicarum]|uniref:Uncharacterized protein n=1 Tax=Ktedonospora formicarum TaxID=2778364 RepID=A0A8J3HX06_9CHLR|nr:DUF5947 family protein [Ktedonospora formicarum]GHO42585.1 hypothetical protein KSX_07480 [Ktedonospora formicarum]